MDEDGLIRILRDFRDRRNWAQYHNPKNLAVSVSIEAGELLEVFQWLTLDESRHLDSVRREKLTDEIADVGIYLLLLADAYGISVEEAIREKIARNETRFPVSGQEKG